METGKHKSGITTTYVADGHEREMLVINMWGATCKVCTFEKKIEIVTGDDQGMLGVGQFLKVYEVHNDEGLFVRLDPDTKWKVENVLLAQSFSDNSNFVDFVGKAWRLRAGQPLQDRTLAGTVIGEGMAITKFIVIDTKKNQLSDFEPVQPDVVPA